MPSKKRGLGKKWKRRKEKASDNVASGGMDAAYVVEKVIGERINGKTGRRHYRLKWQGYGSEDDSWEPEDNVDCSELIEEFYERTGRSSKGPNKPSVQVVRKKYGCIIEYLELKDGMKTESADEKNSTATTASEATSDLKMNDPTLTSSATKAPVLPSEINILVKGDGRKSKSDESSDHLFEDSNATIAVTSSAGARNSNKIVDKVSTSRSALLKAQPSSASSSKIIESPELVAKSRKLDGLQVEQHSVNEILNLSVSTKKPSASVLNNDLSTSAKVSPRKKCDFDVSGNDGNSQIVNADSDEYDEEKSLENRRYPLPGLSFMEMGAIPQYILTIVEPHGDHPLSYVVKYKNKRQMECIPSYIISKMWPQVVIDFYEKWLAESNV